MTAWYDYMIKASRESQGDGDLWFRYLYKVIQDSDTKLSPKDVEELLNSHQLSPFQKVTLHDAMTEGTYTREHVLNANRKSTSRDILQLYRDGKYG